MAQRVATTNMETHYASEPMSVRETAVKEGYTVIMFDDSFPTERPLAKEVFLYRWKKAGIVIKWPKGATAKEAILQWARKQKQPKLA